jgi:predicted site-specific integrase-resolvase
MKRTREAQQRKQVDPLLKPAEVARLLGVSESTVSRWIRQELLVVVYLPSGRPAVRRSEAEQFI